MVMPPDDASAPRSNRVRQLAKPFSADYLDADYVFSHFLSSVTARSPATGEFARAGRRLGLPEEPVPPREPWQTPKGASRCQVSRGNPVSLLVGEGDSMGSAPTEREFPSLEGITKTHSRDCTVFYSDRERTQAIFRPSLPHCEHPREQPSHAPARGPATAAHGPNAPLPPAPVNEALWGLPYRRWTSSNFSGRLGDTRGGRALDRCPPGGRR